MTILSERRPRDGNFEEVDSGRGIGIALLVSAGHFVHDVFASFLPIVLPLLIDKLGLSLLAAGSFTAFFRAPTFLGPAVGRLADRKDMRTLAAISPAVTGICMSSLGLSADYLSVSVMVFVAGISSALIHVLGPVIITRNTTGHHGKGMSLWMLGGESSRAFGPIFVAWSIALFSFEKVYPLMMFGILFSFLMLVCLHRIDLADIPPLQERTKTSWKNLLHRMLPLSIIIVARAAMVGTLVSFLPTYVVSTGKSLWAGGLAFALMQFCGIFGTLLGGFACDRYGARPVLLISFPLSAAMMFTMVNVSGWIILPVLGILGGSIFAIAPVILAILQENFKDELGAANGLYMTINFAATAAATLIMGVAGDLRGLGFAFELNAIIGIITIPAVFFLSESRSIERA